MTLEEIKQTYTMRDVLSRYGISVRGNMCRCPFHGKDRKPSMKVFKDGYNCFTCGSNGDIFSFIQQMDSCGFKFAFYSLGGTYEEQSDKQRKIANARLKKEKEKRDRLIKNERDFKNQMSICIELARNSIEKDEPYSDRWVLSQNFFPIITEWWDEKYLEEREVNSIYVLRVCARFRQRFDSCRGTIG